MAVKGPGSIIDHVRELAAALRAKDWAGAFSLVIDIFQHLNTPLDVEPQPMFGVSDGATVADRLEAVASAKGADEVGALPWAALVPLLIQALVLIFNRPK